MQPSGQAWAQVLQPVQRSSNQSRFVRARGDIGRVTSGNSMVATGMTMRLMVTIMPLRRPIPYKGAPERVTPASKAGGSDSIVTNFTYGAIGRAKWCRGAKNGGRYRT